MPLFLFLAINFITILCILHIFFNFNTLEQDVSNIISKCFLHRHKYEVIVSDKEIPEDLLHADASMQTTIVEQSPTMLSAYSTNSPLYVGIRAVTDDGYYSDLSEVHTLKMEGEYLYFVIFYQ